MTVRKHVPPHLLTPGAKRRVALAVVFGAEVVLGLIAVSAFLPARSAAGAASPQAGSSASAAGYTAARTVQSGNSAAHSGYAATAAHSSEAASSSYTAARTVQPTNYSAARTPGAASLRNAAIVKLAACETDTECSDAEEALRAAGCRFAAEGSSTILCPVDRGAVTATPLPLMAASLPEAALPATTPQIAFYTTEHGKEDCLADAEALPGGQVCIADYEAVR